MGLDDTTHKIVIGGFFNFNGHKIARISHAIVDIGDAINIRCLTRVAALKQQFSFFTNSFNQNLNLLPYPRLVALGKSFAAAASGGLYALGQHALQLELPS